MKRVASILVFSIYLHAVLSEPCPEKDLTLVRWSDHANTWNGVPPGKDDNVVITQSILLDEQPPTLWSITIKSGGKLVWDPNTEVHLKVHWIQVDGELHIGSEDCPFEQNTRIVFLGNVEENDLGAGGDKALFVTDGGVLEIHGKPKLSWTKLTQTTSKLSENSIVNLKNIDDESVNGKGLVVYSINPKTGSLDNKAYFNLNSKRDLSNGILNFVTFLNDITTGNIVGVAVKRQLARKGNVDIALEAIEILAGHEVGAGPLRDTKGAAYAMVTVKGHPELTTEMHKPWTSEKITAAEVNASFGDLYVNISSVYFSKKHAESYAHVFVADDQAYRPTITLLNKVTTWEAGDKLIMASTDYDWKQAEEVEVIKCDSCSDYQVRLSAPLKYTHYGEIYKNVDMRGEVGLLSRNIFFESEDAEGSDTYGGNIKNVVSSKPLSLLARIVTSLAGMGAVHYSYARAKHKQPITLQLYRGGHFYWWRKPEYPVKTSELLQVTDKLSEGVRVAVCLPPGAEFELTGMYPTKYKFSSWTKVTSVTEVDSIAEYFFDPDTGYLSLYLTNEKDFDENELGSCHKDECTEIDVQILSGDRTNSDCLDAVHQKFDITKKIPEDRRRIRQLIDLLRRRLDQNRQESLGFLGKRHRRSAYTTKYDERELPATAAEPEANWGAGATKF